MFNGLCGYALGVVKMRGHKLIWSLLMALLLVPSTGGFVVLYRSFVQLGINQGQIWPLYLGSGGSPFTIMMFKVFFEGIPRDYFEAASIDGASHVNIFSRIILPLSTPIVAITAINAFKMCIRDRIRTPPAIHRLAPPACGSGFWRSARPARAGRARVRAFRP